MPKDAPGNAGDSAESPRLSDLASTGSMASGLLFHEGNLRNEMINLLDDGDRLAYRVCVARLAVEVELEKVDLSLAIFKPPDEIVIAL